MKSLSSWRSIAFKYVSIKLSLLNSFTFESLLMPCSHNLCQPFGVSYMLPDPLIANKRSVIHRFLWIACAQIVVIAGMAGESVVRSVGNRNGGYVDRLLINKFNHSAGSSATRLWVSAQGVLPAFSYNGHETYSGRDFSFGGILRKPERGIRGGSERTGGHRRKSGPGGEPDALPGAFSRLCG